MMSRLRTLSLLLGACALTLARCEGPEGPTGPTGPVGIPGMTGPAGPPAPTGCPGDGLGLHAEIKVSAPAHGAFFSAGEAPRLDIRFLDRCGQPVVVKDLGTAELFVHGPREPLLDRTASHLLNCVTDRMAKDRQHHAINLIAPHYADPAQANLKQDADGTLHYQLAAITNEPPGTYSAGVWAKTTDELEQVFPLADFQIGTATVTAYESGPAEASTCAACHLGPETGKLYINHVYPGFSPLGNWSLDAFPVGTCKNCHNLDGLSENPAVRKVHAAHRGAHQVAPGVAHPEYGLGADTSLADFTDVVFPSLPDNEKDCAKCHAGDRWQTAPSRLGCGTCHEALFFDTGSLNPPRRLAQACTKDADCTPVGALPAACNTMAGTCELRVHPKQKDDSQCATCHSADASGLVPVAASHEVLSRTRVRHLQISAFSLGGGSGPGGTVMAGDAITVQFKLSDGMGNAVADLKSNAALSGTLIIGGPTDDRQLAYPALSLKAQGTLSYDAGSQLYTYAPPTPFPATSQPPQNQSGGSRPNPPGTYTAWLYVVETMNVSGQQVRDAANALADFRFGDGTLPLLPRQVITRAACDSCHVNTQAHGGTRQQPEGCSLCHTAGSTDRTVGAAGASCSTNSDCRSWESCQARACVITTDPTPDRSIFFSSMIHSIHFGRLLEGYSERNDLLSPGALVYVGYRNGVSDFSQVLLPMDVRNCSKCHADSGAMCSDAAPCGIGQECVSGQCRNRAWQEPSAAVCLSCHDADDSNGHAAINTWTDKDGTVIETCGVCHGPGGEFAVAKVHNISAPYVPPYPRTPGSN